MKQALTVVFLLYVVALHCSIAAMETTGWLLFVLVAADRIRSGKLAKPPLWIPLVTLVACVGMGLILNPPLKPLMMQLGFMRWIVLFWTFIWLFEDLWSPGFEKLFARTWLGICAVLSGYVVIQFLTGIDFRPGHHVLEVENHVYRATGFFSNCLTLAYVIGASYFAVAGASKRLPKIWMAVFLAGGFLAIVGSMSRGALLAAIATAGFYLAVQQRRWLPYFAGLCFAGVMALSLIWGKLGELVSFRMGSSSSERVHLWRGYFNMFLDHPLFGVGIFQGDKLLPEYYGKLGIEDTFYSHAHNVGIQWLGGAGAIAFLLYWGLAFTFLKWAWGLRRKSEWGWPLLLSQLYVHLGGMTEANFFDGEVNHIVVLTWALTAFLHARQREIRA